MLLEGPPVEACGDTRKSKNCMVVAGFEEILLCGEKSRERRKELMKHVLLEALHFISALT